MSDDTNEQWVNITTLHDAHLGLRREALIWSSNPDAKIGYRVRYQPPPIVAVSTGEIFELEDPSQQWHYYGEGEPSPLPKPKE